MHTFKVSGMGCGSCVAKITAAIHALDSSASVNVDLSQGQVKIESSLAYELLASAIKNVGFDVQ